MKAGIEEEEAFWIFVQLFEEFSVGQFFDPLDVAFPKFLAIFTSRMKSFLPQLYDHMVSKKIFSLFYNKFPGKIRTFASHLCIAGLIEYFFFLSNDLVVSNFIFLFFSKKFCIPSVGFIFVGRTTIIIMGCLVNFFCYQRFKFFFFFFDIHSFRDELLSKKSEEIMQFMRNIPVKYLQEVLKIIESQYLLNHF